MNRLTENTKRHNYTTRARTLYKLCTQIKQAWLTNNTQMTKYIHKYDKRLHTNETNVTQKTHDNCAQIA